MIEKINKILIDWDPIGVREPISRDEYKQYCSTLLPLLQDKEQLKKQLFKILTDLGLDFDSNDNDQKKDIESVVQKLYDLTA